ncbi:Aste57867_18750 [Aphanomyces stellatus]|uniref:Aste57867_18750 protein n=1 Tax=Aphanomyces stellatus TaxID=120398 RepID=A0A485LB53_9STRA|nr:hypothetical protein As57867_018686 [Aphanomyces stellatus]VFT95484.1 Aste57867_18750 [Aphanomyces stellatus]
MAMEPTACDFDEEDSADELPPWLVGVRMDEFSVDESVVRCAGILEDGSRCTRTYAAQKHMPPISYCFKHRCQMHTSTHGYAPLAQSDLQQNPKQRRATAKGHASRCSLHWTYQSMCALFSLFLAIGLLFMSIMLRIPHLGLASGFFFCVPMVLLAHCMCRMMLAVFLPTPAASEDDVASMPHHHAPVQSA